MTVAVGTLMYRIKHEHFQGGRGRQELVRIEAGRQVAYAVLKPLSLATRITRAVSAYDWTGGC